jgi:hypothetical protein
MSGVLAPREICEVPQLAQTQPGFNLQRPAPELPPPLALVSLVRAQVAVLSPALRRFTSLRLVGVRGHLTFAKLAGANKLYVRVRFLASPR